MRALVPGLISLELLIVSCGGTATPMQQNPDLRQPPIDCVANPGACACKSDSDCAVSSDGPRCDVTSGRCVACLPDPDNCPAGQVCREVNGSWSCAATCQSNADCQKLGGGSICCQVSCVNPATDVKNCGGCNNACPNVANGSSGCSSGTCIVASCNAGFEDCDKSPLNGCEVETNKDPENCGACGHQCKPFLNGLPTCTLGKCSAICAPGYADCNANTDDGCEVDVTLDVKSCGGCGRVCAALPNADPACDQGKCSFRCKLGFGDCDGNPANGCETNTGTDNNHCGRCGNICPLRPNSDAAVCQGGQCQNTCKQGFGDCDNLPFNGCEADLQNNLNNCGGCGKICKNNNALATCSQGSCNLQCNPGYTDCDKDVRNGCEANLLNDAMNCGACGNACPQNLPGCANGNCVACGNDCWGATGCLTAGGRCIRFTCRAGNAGAAFCNGCMGWKDISYDQWMKQGYCQDIIARYRMSDGTATRCGGAAACCGNQGACGGGDNAWHFFDGNSGQNYFVGPCIGCANDVNCSYWNSTDNGTYTRITACVR